MSTVKCVLVGDGAVGKTCLTTCFTGDYTPTVFNNHSIIAVMIDNQPIQLNVWDTPGRNGYESLRQLAYPKTNVFLLCYDLMRKKSLINTTKWYFEIKKYCSTAKCMLIGCKADLYNQYIKIKHSYNENKRIPTHIKIIQYYVRIAFQKTVNTFGLQKIDCNNFPSDLMDLVLKYSKFTDSEKDIKLFKYNMAPSEEEIEFLANEINAYCEIRCSAMDSSSLDTLFNEVVKCGMANYNKNISCCVVL